jgi:hypothetical protein
MRLNVYGTMKVKYAHRTSFARVFEEFHKEHCPEVREKIFGLPSFGDWPSDLERIPIDYNMPVLDLAIQLVQCWSPTENFGLPPFISKVMETLGVSATGPKVAKMLHHRAARPALKSMPMQRPPEQDHVVPRSLETSWDVNHISASPSGHPQVLTVELVHQYVPKELKPRINFGAWSSMKALDSALLTTCLLY